MRVCLLLLYRKVVFYIDKYDYLLFNNIDLNRCDISKLQNNKMIEEIRSRSYIEFRLSALLITGSYNGA